jgi:hypothetical protein
MAVSPVAGLTHHFVLESGDGTRLGLLSPDNMASFLRSPIARTALKMAQGDTRYSDMEPPYTTEMQEDFSGGRGQRWLNDDKTKFYDSENLDTRVRGQCFLGPKTNMVTIANVGMPEYNPGNVADVWVPYARTQHTRYPSWCLPWTMLNPTIKYAQSFKTPNATNLKITSVALKMLILSAENITVAIQADDDDEPSGTNLVSVTMGMSPGSPSDGTFTFVSSYSLAADTTYWIVISWPTAILHQLCGTQYDSYSDGKLLCWWDAASKWHLGGNPEIEQDAYFIVGYEQVKYACSFSASLAGSDPYSVTHAMVYLKKSGTVGPTVRIETDSGGSPSGILADTGHTLATATIDNADIYENYAWVRADFTTFTLAQDTTYWLVVYEGSQRSSGNALYWGADSAAGNTGSAAKYNIGGAGWTADTANDMYFRINSGQGLTDQCAFLFEYKHQMFAVTAPLEGADASTLWMNGDCGAADSNTSNKLRLVDATKSWTTNEWAGCVALITGGTGKREWRTIASNTATYLVSADAWTTTHDTTTEYVILGSQKWTDVTPVVAGNYIATLTAKVTDVCVANGIIYLAQGDSVDILRVKNENVGGTWTGYSDSDTANKATRLMCYNGMMYRVTATNQASSAPLTAWGTDLVFQTAGNIGTSDWEINRPSVYDGDVYYGKEDSLWVEKSQVISRIPINTEPLASTDNFRALVWHNSYLFFTFGHGLERMYGLQVDDMGPNRDEGLLEGRQGPISALIPLPGSLFASIDAGDTGTSSILVYNDLGWHELVRGTINERIQCMCMQVIPGGPNRLWFGHGNDVCYALMPSRGVNPLKDSTYRYRASGSVTTSWVDLGLATVTKYFKDLKIVADNLATNVKIRAWYQIDNATDAQEWLLIGDYTTSPYQELAIPDSDGANFLTGKRIRFKFELISNDATTTPVLLAYTVDALARIPPKSTWSPEISLLDYPELLDGQTKDLNYTRAAIIAQLDTWSASAEPLYFTSADPVMSGIMVLVDQMVELDKKYEAAANGTGVIVCKKARLTLLEA